MDSDLKCKPTHFPVPPTVGTVVHSNVLDSRLVFSHAQRTRALVYAIGETLWRAGGRKKAIVAVLDIPGICIDQNIKEEEQDEAIAKALKGVCLDSGKELHGLVRFCEVTSILALRQQLQDSLPGFRSPMGALLLLFSALLSRGLEIVNLLLCGHAVPNVFDGNLDMGGGMCLKGIPTSVEVGFLTLLESLNLCKVGRYLKCPRWPIWVIGSESHYSILFAFTTTVQEESEFDDRETCVRQAFDAQDQSGGGGFISPEALQQILVDLNIEMNQDVLNTLCSSDIVVWNDFWQALLELDKSKGGLKDSYNTLRIRQFDLYHFNGIAKTVATVGDVSQQQPHLTRIKVSVPPKWTPDTVLAEGFKGSLGDRPHEASDSGISNPEPAQHAPLVDCIRTRWQCATCNWAGDAPSIV
ncbi:hypothetical protein CY35_12G075700 [Sphagnum magellanicum]|nr:hypothetical protein CY35_12G075700 [Sphagnum magellanicum]